MQSFFWGGRLIGEGGSDGQVGVSRDPWKLVMENGRHTLIITLFTIFTVSMDDIGLKVLSNGQAYHSHSPKEEDQVARIKGRWGGDLTMYREAPPKKVPPHLGIAR